MDEFFNQPDDLGTVTLTLDNDEELECDIITFFTAGDNEYVALAPQGDEFDGIVYLYRYIEHDGEEEPELITIESDEEYEIASDGFDEWLDNLEFEELPTVEYFIDKAGRIQILSVLLLSSPRKTYVVPLPALHLALLSYTESRPRYTGS